VIADGKYRATSLGRNAWKTLIGSQSSSCFVWQHEYETKNV